MLARSRGSVGLVSLLLVSGVALGACAPSQAVRIAAPTPTLTSKPSAPSMPTPETVTETITLSIVGINDLHGRMQQLPRLGGYVKNLRAARAADHGALLLLDAGDIFQGTLESNLGEGEGMVRAENALGLTAAALGNHEFDFGPIGPHSIPLEAGEDPLGAIGERVKEARFPFLSANLYAKGDGAANSDAMPVPGVLRSFLLTAAGVKVGLIGALTSGALSQTHADNVHGVIVERMTPAIGREAQALRAQGAQVVIAIVHAGGDCHDVSHPDDLSSCEDGAEVFTLARSLPAHAVDAIVAGHTHAGVAQRVAGIPIIESYAKARAFGRVDLRVELPSGRVAESRILPPHGICGSVLDPDAELPAVCPADTYEGAAVLDDDAVSAAIAGDIARAKGAGETLVGITLPEALQRGTKQESALGNLLADAMLRAVPKADAAFNNGGSLRTGLPAGPLDFGHVFELFPFDNVLATLHMRASDLATVVKNNLGGGHAILALAGLRARARCENGALRVEILRANGTLVPDATLLTVVTSDFVATHGDDLLRGVTLEPSAVTINRSQIIRDVLVADLRATAKKPPRPTDKRLFDPEHPRLDYPGTRPVRCETTHE